MRKILILMLIALFLIGGCSQAPEEKEVPVDGEAEEGIQPESPTTQEIDEVPETTVQEPVQEPAEADEPVQVQQTKELNPKVESLLSKVDGIKSYEFYYQTSDNWDLIRDKYYIKDNKMKIKLFDVNYYNKRNYFDTVYLDMDEETAVAYCEEPGHTRCVDPDKEFVISYDDFMIKTPVEWVKEIEYAEWIGTQQLDQRAADIIEYENDDGTTTRMWIDSYSGLARQIWIYRGDTENIIEKYGFRDLAINSVKSSEMEHEFQ